MPQHEMLDIVTELNNAIRDSEIDIQEVEWSKNAMPEKFGEYEVVFADRTGVDYDGYKMVLYFKEADSYVAIDGSYSSYGGVEYYRPRFYAVKPVEKTVITYQSV